MFRDAFAERDVRFRFESSVCDKSLLEEYFYYFEKSPLLQLFMLYQYKSKMLADGDTIKKEVQSLEATAKNSNK